MELDGRVAVVTGGASGIGQACARALARRGARTVTWDLAPGADIPVDVADEAAVDRALAETIAEAGDRPSLLVAAAGVPSQGLIADVDAADWDRTFAVNVRGVMLCLRAFVRARTDVDGDAGVVVVSSVNGVVADPGIAAYSASKAAVHQLVRVAARELGARGIRVNAVGPGPTETPMLGELLARPGFRDEVVARTPLGDVGTPERIADAVVAVLSTDWVTGQVVLADGGSSLVTARSGWQAGSAVTTAREGS